MDTQQVEKNIQIAERVPPGDRWKLLGGEKIYESITEVLNAYYQVSSVKPTAFRLEPMKSKLYVITTQEIEIPKAEPKKYDLYGDFE
jgi:hypothetical protein